MVDWLLENIGDEVPVHFTAFHPDFRMRDILPTPPATLSRAREIAIKGGIKYAYTGNVHDVKRQSTYCPNCKKCIIERDWFELGKYRVAEGKCMECKTPIAGVFEDLKGNWGRQRQPVVISQH